MFDVKIDENKNRIYITLGRIEKQEVKQVTDAIRQALSKLAINFTCITDISEFDPVSDDETHRIAEIQKTMQELGMAKVIRVVGDSKLGHFLMDEISKREAGYSANIAKSVQDAEKMLDG